MVDKILRRIRKTVTRPHLIPLFIKNRMVKLPYYFGRGTWAMNPRVVKLYINNVCNAQCLICDVGQKNRKSVFYQQARQDGSNTLSVSDCQRIMTDVRKFKPRIHVHGLEPLLHENILDLVATIKKSGLYLHMVTNGILLPAMAKDLIGLAVNQMTISLDGPEEVHNKIRGPGIYQKAIEGIRLLKKYRSQAGEKKTKIAINFTINDRNYHTIKEFAHTMISEEGVDFITFIHMYFMTAEANDKQQRSFPHLGASSPINTKAFDPANVDVDILWSQLQQIRKQFKYDQIRFNTEFKNKKQLTNFYHTPGKSVSNITCKTPWTSTTILANGDVVINNRCFYYKTSNIHQETFKEIWNGERYSNFRRELRRAKSFPACIRCHGTYPKM